MLKDYIEKAESLLEEEIMLARFGFGDANEQRLKSLLRSQLEGLAKEMAKECVVEKIEAYLGDPVGLLDLQQGFNQACSEQELKVKTFLGDIK